MHQLWTDDTETIKDEIAKIIQSNVSLFCNRRGVQSRRELTINKLISVNDRDLLVVDHPNEPSCSAEGCLFYYHLPGSPLRYFKCSKIKWAKKYLGLELPTEIFNVNQRKNSRLTTPVKSTATFTLQNRQRLYSAIVDDISITGARFTTDILAELSTGDIITPFTLSLSLEFSSSEEFHINIPQAEIVWTKFDGKQTYEVGVKFEMPDTEETTMSVYMNMRALEESIKDKRKVSLPEL